MNTVLSLIIMVSFNTLKNDPINIISHYIMNHIYEVKDMTILTLAKNCYTSTTSIIKFCELLGFSSYNTFKKNLYTGIQTRKFQLTEKYDDINIDYYLNHMQSISHEEVDINSIKEQIKECVEYIHNNKKIHIYGAVFPLALSISFIEDMMIMGIPVDLCQMHYGDIDIVDDEGIHLIVSLTGRFMSYHKNIYHQLSRKGNNTILLSQNINDSHLLMNIHLPQTVNYEYGEFMILLMFDMIKLEYYKNYTS